jgi:hypothetical protein
VLDPAKQTTATFDYVDASMVSSATVTATLGASNASSTITVKAGTSGLVINEVDYDSVGTDNGEFVEILNTSSAPIDLTPFDLVLVNGSNNAVYLTYPLAPAGTIMPGQYLVIGTATVTPAAGALSLQFKLASDNVQNGAPDGMAIVDHVQNKLVDALSYEGSITAAVIPGVGTVSLVEGTALPASVADSNTMVASLCRIPDGSDTNDAATDWKLSSTPTPGAANVP